MRVLFDTTRQRPADARAKTLSLKITAYRLNRWNLLPYNFSKYFAVAQVVDSHIRPNCRTLGTQSNATTRVVRTAPTPGNQFERAKEVVAVAKEKIEFIRMIFRELASKRHHQSNS